MSYVQGFVLAIPTANKEAYRDYARASVPYFKNLGALRMVECWGDNTPDGQVTDFRRAVLAREDETVVFSWIIWPDKATCDAAGEVMMSDPAMEEMAKAMPGDGRRMIYGGFEPLVDE